MIAFTVNGVRKEIGVDANTPLLWVLREHLALTGTRLRHCRLRRLHGPCRRPGDPGLRHTTIAGGGPVGHHDRRVVP